MDMTPTPISPRSIDAMVAENIMLWKWWHFHGIAGDEWCFLLRPESTAPQDYKAILLSAKQVNKKPEGVKDLTNLGGFSPSTQIAAAMEVVDHLKVDEIHLVRKIRSKFWYCRLLINEFGCTRPSPTIVEAEAPTRELAICLAALKVKGVEV